MEQLQEVCLSLDADALGRFADQIEKTLVEEKDEEFKSVVSLFHDEIRKTGSTPIEDDSVQLKPEVDSESTATPIDSCNEEQQHEPEASPEKAPEGPSAEDMEKER